MTYKRPTRSPEELLCSDLPDWAVRVWIAVRAVQGANDEAWAFYEEYAARSNKSEAMVRKAVGLLKREGWIEETQPASRGSAPHLRCHVPLTQKGENADSTFAAAKGENPVPKGENGVPTKRGKVRTTFQKGENPVPERSEQGSQPPTPPYKEESVQESVQESVHPPKSPKGDGGGFDAFWTAFPKKRGKAKARTAYAKAVRGAPDLPAVLLADVARRQTDDYRWTKEDGRYIPDPTTYLNQERWHDEYQPTPKLSAVDAAKERAAAARANPREAYEHGALEALAAIDPGFAGMAGARVDENHRLGG